jgi:NADH:ubiquinone oxidoreductase subunit 5 (subunit L)/multisubunit Na+/H+ antiporter MnhA subunit
VPNANKTSYLNIHAETSIVIIPLSILALFAIFLGFIASDFVGIGSDFFGSSLFYHPSHLHIIEAEFSLPIYIKLMPTLLSLVGGCFALYIYHFGYKFFTGWTFPFYDVLLNNSNILSSTSSSSFLIEKQGLQNKAELNNTLIESRKINDLLATSPRFAKGSPRFASGRENNNSSFKIGHNNSIINSGFSALIINSYTFLNGKYLLDNLYNNYLISGGLKLGFTISKLLDKGIIELIGPFGLTEGSYSASSTLSKLDTGVITTYALYITLGLISILFILFSPMFTIQGLHSGNSNFALQVIEGTTNLVSAHTALTLPGGEGDISNLTIEELKNNYTYSIKILLLSIFSTYILLSL